MIDHLYVLLLLPLNICLGMGLFWKHNQIRECRTLLPPQLFNYSKLKLWTTQLRWDERGGGTSPSPTLRCYHGGCHPPVPCPCSCCGGGLRSTAVTATRSKGFHLYCTEKTEGRPCPLNVFFFRGFTLAIPPVAKL